MTSTHEVITTLGFTKLHITRISLYINIYLVEKYNDKHYIYMFFYWIKLLYRFHLNSSGGSEFTLVTYQRRFKVILFLKRIVRHHAFYS